MNREIKFRVWNRVKKKLIKPFDLIELSDLGNKRNFPLSNLMQYTGLKDKNGKEIYEGDIIKTLEYDCFRDNYITNISVVKYGEHSNKFDSDCAEVGYSCIGFYLSREENCLLGEFNNFDDCEVIGNIYENPELLEKEK